MCLVSVVCPFLFVCVGYSVCGEGRVPVSLVWEFFVGVLCAMGHGSAVFVAAFAFCGLGVCAGVLLAVLLWAVFGHGAFFLVSLLLGAFSSVSGDKLLCTFASLSAAVVWWYS